MPRATYRVQLGPEFGFDEVAELVPYLAALGVSHLYASPCLQAVPGSTHGYDVVDPTCVSEDLGGEAGHRRLTEALAAAGMGQVLDIVPNHMAIAPGNRLWWDVLENGSASAYAHFFDVDWDPPEFRLKNRILLPVLEDHYGRVLERGLLGLGEHEGRLVVRYRDHLFPLSPTSLPLLLGPAAEASGAEPLHELARGFADLPEPALSDVEARRERHERLQALHRRLGGLLDAKPAARAALAAVARRTEAHPDALDELLERQHYRLAFWRAGVHDFAYRRFFDVDSLVALRVEHEDVFEHTHGRVLRWLGEGVLDGVRIDHPDGLRQPARYFARLRERAPDAWIVVEKILEPSEPLPEAWPVQGTTGYEFLNDVGGLLLDASAEAPLTELYQELTGDRRTWREIVVAAKRRALQELLAPDLERLTQLLLAVCEGHRRYRDHTRQELREALLETAAHLPVYRTYVEEDAPAGGRDAEYVEAALAGAARDRADLSPDLLGLLRRILLGREEGTGPLETELRMRFQQLTGAVTAKAVEDTAFYAWPRFAALSEVGGDPERFGLSPADFHLRAQERQARWPASMLSLSTHDTKRGEDVRARLMVLSEVPELWAETVRGWARQNRRHKNEGFPDPAMEYLYYQTLVGAWPLEAERAVAYLEKASREAKVHTAWLAPDPAYEAALAAFARETLADAEFRRAVERFVARVEDAGWKNALAQKLVQLTAPGVPDIYRGAELWDLNLVDPDNRRPVDFTLRKALLEALAGDSAPTGEALWRRRAEGLPKLKVVREALRLRSERPAAFSAGGEYQPLPLTGEAAGHLVAFARGGEVATLVPRLNLRLEASGGWRDTEVQLPPGQWADRLSGRRWSGGGVRAGALLEAFPVALLALEGGGAGA